MFNGFPIPEWVEGDGYVHYTLKVPNHKLWLAYFYGSLVRLSNLWMFDHDADIAERREAARIAYEIPNSLRLGYMELQFLAYAQALQSIPGSYTDNVLQLPNTEYNLDGQWNTTTYTWTVPSTGSYRVGAFVQIGGLTATGDIVRVKAAINGVNRLNSGNLNHNADNFKPAFFELPVYLVSGDTVQFLTGHSNAAAKNTDAQNRTTRAWAYKL